MNEFSDKIKELPGKGTAMEFMDTLKNCILFRGLVPEEINSCLNDRLRIIKYEKNQVVALEGDPCDRIGIILSGVAEVRKIFISGKSVTVERLHPGDIFGEVIIYSDMKRYPSTIVAAEPTAILFLARTEVTRLCGRDSRILVNFMGLLSNKILMLNRKVKNLSCHSLREKICAFLMEEYHKQKSPTLRLPFSRKVMAEQLGVPRPSLSREMVKMQKDGLIEFHGNTVILLDVESLEYEV